MHFCFIGTIIHITNLYTIQFFLLFFTGQLNHDLQQVTH